MVHCLQHLTRMEETLNGSDGILFEDVPNFVKENWCHSSGPGALVEFMEKSASVISFSLTGWVSSVFMWSVMVCDIPSRTISK